MIVLNDNRYVQFFDILVVFVQSHVIGEETPLVLDVYYLNKSLYYTPND